MSASLFSPLRIRSLTLRNRIVVSPMCQYSSVDGFANDWHLVHLGGFAVGGAALVVAEATAVSPDAHAGRKASVDAPFNGGKPLDPEHGGWSPLFAPSAIPFGTGYQSPVAMSTSDIARVVADFRTAAQRAFSAGFRVLELHGAHGYLLHEFLSPLSNTRDDEYGGSFENRIRFVLETIDAVRGVWPDQLPLFLRVSATDWAEGGWHLDECVELSRIAGERGVDLVDCSTGGNVSGVKIPTGPGSRASCSAIRTSHCGRRASSVWTSHGRSSTSGQSCEWRRRPSHRQSPGFNIHVSPLTSRLRMSADDSVPISRRAFVKNTATTAAALAVGPMIVPRHVLGMGFQAPSDTLNVAMIGIGGMGKENMISLVNAGANIVAICDADWGYVERAMAGRLRPPQGQTELAPQMQAVKAAFEKAKRYTDYRTMLEEQRDIDAVSIATPDHLHAVIAYTAMKHGKHVYVQKPLTYSVQEARILARTARDTKVVSQMGNQGHSMDGTRRLVEIINAGVIGPIREVHVWTDRPQRYWAQGIPRPALPGATPAPSTAPSSPRWPPIRRRSRPAFSGISSSDRPSSTPITRPIIRSVGAAGWTSASAPSATWAPTSSTNRSGPSDSACRPPSRPRPRRGADPPTIPGRIRSRCPRATSSPRAAISRPSS